MRQNKVEKEAEGIKEKLKKRHVVENETRGRFYSILEENKTKKNKLRKKSLRQKGKEVKKNLE